MLTSDFLDVLPNDIVRLYDDYSLTIIMDIARRLEKMGKITDTAAWQMQRLTESGLLYEKAISELSKLSNISRSELEKMFTQAGVKSLKFDDMIYKRAGLNPLPLNLSPAMAQVLSAGLAKTGGVIRNLTMTTAIGAQRSFIAASDMAYLQVSSGAMSYDQAIRAAIKSVAAKGVSTIDYATGHQDQLDVAIRRTVLTGVSQTAGVLQSRRADEMGQDLVQTSAHYGARPEHAIWQGRVFSRSGASRQYPDFVTSTGYGTGPGLGGWNCRHSYYPYFDGISENAYSEADRENLRNKTVTLAGKEISAYDATQIQRGLERKIRYWKRQSAALGAGRLSSAAENAKVSLYQSQMREFVKQTGLNRQSPREQVVK